MSDTPRVTEVLRPFTSYHQVPKDVLEKAAAKGTSVHALCADIAKGNWIPESMIDEELKGYIQSFKKWSEAQVKKFVIIEQRYSEEDLKYNGQVDFVIVGSDDELYLVDLKTGSSPQKTYPVQMAAYNHLLRRHQVNVKGAMLVYLDKDGDFPDIDFLDDMNEEFSVFLCALECYNYFKRRKKRNGKSRDEDARIEDGSIAV